MLDCSQVIAVRSSLRYVGNLLAQPNLDRSICRCFNLAILNLRP